MSSDKSTPELPADRVTVKTAAHLLGCDVATIYRAVQRGELGSWRVGGTRIWLSRAQVLARIEHSPPGPPLALSV